MKMKTKVSLILPDIRSAHNVGSIFRTADAAGVEKVYIAGYTPCPVDKYGRVQNEIAKTALGGEKSVTWEYCSSVGPLLTRLKKRGDVLLIALEQDATSVDYKKLKGLVKKSGASEKQICIVLGNEVKGLPKNILKKMDIIAEISMKGEKESLNVSVATGILLFSLM
ncbi:MAG: hypothetical protein RL094_65 [Candidatus Parcubacteria bacterium]|jgi:tRNA G18 (ribose-2'-O)-methylase SpoU